MSLLAASLNLLFSHYFYIQLRWKSVSRGMGAPGFMTYWLGWAVFWLTLTTTPFGSLRPLALLVLQIDFALIMLFSGIYKFASGYLYNQGFQLGLVNPQWSYFYKFYTKWPARHFLFWLWNQTAWLIEILSAILLMIPGTRMLGCILLIAVFLFTTTQIRLGVLCGMVMLCTMLYLISPSSSYPDASATPWMATPLTAFLIFHLLLLPAAYLGLAYNFYARKSLPVLLQKALEAYSNLFGIHLWRVFSSDIVNFFIQIYTRPKNSNERKFITHFGWKGGWRFSHVGEMITLTSLFTTLKYFPNDRTLFEERLKRYARTLPHASNELIVFEYVAIQTRDGRFEHRPAAYYEVDLARDEIIERQRDPAISVYKPHEFSRIHVGERPGSYLPYSSNQA